MTFSDLKSKLKPLSQPGANPPEQLVMDAALIESDRIIALWHATLGTNAFTITEPRVSFPGSQIVVAGKAPMLTLEPVPVQAVFEEGDQELKFRIKANLPDTWKFGQSFPNLPESFNFDSRNYGYGESYLKSLPFCKPVFLLTTHACKDPDKDPETAAQFERGLNFRGQLDLAGLFNGSELLTGNKDSVEISGLITSDKAAPEFCLTAKIPLRLGENALAKKFQNVRLKLWNSLSSANTAAAKIELSIELEIVKGKTVELYCPFRIGAPLDFVVIGGRFTGLDLPDLGDIAYLVGGKDLQQKLPDKVRSLGGITIKEVRIGVSLTGPELTYVLMNVSTTSEWTIVENVPEIPKIKSFFVTWLIESPFQSDQRRISCDIEGRLRIVDVDLDVYAHYPGFQVGAALAEGSAIKLGALLKHFIPDSPVPDDSLIVSTLALQINPTSKTFQIDARVDNVWSIPLGSATLDIASLSLSLEKSSGRPTGALEGVLDLHLPVDGSEQKVTLTLSAALPDSSTGGWQFSGRTGQGQRIPLGALIKKLVSMCGEITLPTALETFTIENLFVSFNTQTKKFTFGCEGKFPLIDGRPPIEAKVDVIIDQEKPEKRFEGQLTIYAAERQRLDFKLMFHEKDAQTFLATYHGAASINIDDLLNQIFPSPISTGVKLTLTDALFAYRGDTEGAKYLFGIKMGIGFELKKLPIVGPALPQNLNVSIEDLQILAANRAFSIADVDALNALTDTHIACVKLQDEKQKATQIAVRQGPNVSAKLKVAGADQLLTLPTSQRAEPTANGAPRQPVPGGANNKPTAVADSAKWFDIQKSLGPFHIDRVGMEWKEKRLGFLFDGGLDLLGVRVGLLGLSASLPLSNPSLESLQFGLDGIELAIKRKPVEIAGALLKVTPLPPGVQFQYDGRVVVRAEAFSLAAVGSYAVINDVPSLFVFAVLHKELGGPSFFFVTGLAFGFGVNRLLKLPAIEDVHNFPLVRAAIDPDYLGGDATPRAALVKLQEYVPPSVGDYWLAAGVKFNSFGMIDSFAVLSISFGTQFQIAILGVSKITVPKQLPGTPVDPVACAELAIKVCFTPATGLLAAEARLTDNSFVFSKDCKLTGGFALYCWFGPDHAGDFVVTLGGYHPKFVPPSHYPLVPRLGIRWPVNDNLKISGELYFALTPSCLMAGGRLEATYQAGPLRAWFTATCDFLINWQPFAYDVDMSLTIGVAYQLSAGDVNTSLAVELGASLHMFGPPFSGKAHVTLYVLSFDLAFGATQEPGLKAVKWDEFQKSFLPQPEKKGNDPLISNIRITGGLIAEREIVASNGQKSRIRLVNPHELSFTTESVVPATSLLFNKTSLEGITSKPLGIRPMDIKDLNSINSVTLSPKGPLDGDWNAYLTKTQIPSNVPAALWSNSGLSKLEKPSNEMIEKVPVGVQVGLEKRPPTHGLAAIDCKKFKYNLIPKDVAWPAKNPPEVIAAPGERTFANTLWGNQTVDNARNSILIDLGKQDARIDVSDLAKHSEEIFQCAPQMARLGQQL